MKKDIEWLKEKLQTMINQEYRCYDPLIQQMKHTCKVIMDLIEQMDESEKEKSVISNIAGFLTEYHYNCGVWGEKEVIYAIDKELTDYYGIKKEKNWIVLCGDLYAYGYNLDQEDIRLTRQKDRSYIFKDKEIATSVAALCSGRVEEVTE